METLRRNTTLDVKEPAARSRSAVGKARPVSVQGSVRYDLPRDHEASRSSLDLSRYEGDATNRPTRAELDREYDQPNISSDMDYLRVKEEEESNRKRDKRASSGAKHSKRSSLSTLSFSGSKNLFAGRFGDAFRRFESSNPDKPTTPSAEEFPSQPQTVVTPENVDSPTESFSPYHDDPLDDLEREDISPEMRRELERRRLSQEEKRVANAAAEYRRRVAEDGSGRAGADGARSRVIQNRVQSLLSETQKPAAVHKSATGYGKYTDTSALQAKQDSVQSSTTGTLPTSKPPAPVYSRHEAVVSAPPDRRDGVAASSGLPPSATSSTPRPATARPPAPPKPKNLRVGTQDSPRPGTGASQDRSPSLQQSSAGPGGEDWEANFSRRFPSLSGIEMETEIELPKFPKLRTREV